MSYNLTPWEFDDVTAADAANTSFDYKLMEAGWRHVKILSATCDDNGKYAIRLQDLQDPEATAYVSYNLYKAGENGEMVKNGWSVATLLSLKKALFDQDKGIPHPTDIVGGVCLAEVRHKTSETSGRTYVNIYKFKPDIEDFVMCGDLVDQFYLPNEAAE